MKRLSILCILLLFFMYSCTYLESDELKRLRTELSYCNNVKRPQGARIKLDNGESCIIHGDGSFELKSNTIAMIEYIYEGE